MKRFWEYDVTEDEMRHWWKMGRRATYDSLVDMFKDDPEPSDSEKREIAMVLYRRGDMSRARMAVESIEDKIYREESAHWLDKLEYEASHPGEIVD